jgi:type IV pilus assembly protein PilM
MRLPSLNMNLAFARRSNASLVGLDIQPGFVAAVEARVNGSVVAERAAALPIAPDTVRDGEVADEGALSESLRELFAGSGLGRRVRVGIANQRTVLRTLELPPVTDQKELAAAVNFQAQEQVPMPLNNAVLDFHALGIIDTPAGPRQRVVLVAAQRDMVERLLAAVRGAGLTPEGVDLSAFALIRALYRPDPERSGRVLYLNVDGLTNLAIAEGPICRFTRVVGGGLEGMAAEIAVRRGISLSEAHALLASVDLDAPAPAEEVPTEAHADVPREGAAEAGDVDGADSGELMESGEASASGDSDEAAAEREDSVERERDESEMSYEELAALEQAAELEPVSAEELHATVLEVLENGIRDISGEVRNSLDFHRSQDGGGEVSHVVLSGAAQDVSGFAARLERALGVEVQRAQVDLSDERVATSVSSNRLAVAAGLAAAETPR